MSVQSAASHITFSMLVMIQIRQHRNSPNIWRMFCKRVSVMTLILILTIQVLIVIQILKFVFEDIDEDDKYQYQDEDDEIASIKSDIEDIAAYELGNFDEEYTE
jgi:hypothetical protein